MTSIMPSTPACKPPVIPPRSSNTTQTSSSYYFASKDSYVREDVDIEVGYYIHKEKLGEGGFSKVRLGTHLLTGEKVAIKCMDKEKLGEDLFRVQTEIRALKILDHQNIAKLLQVIETDAKIYLILEHCSGGELFDYIVAKSRLTEIESQKIMSSLIEVLAYMHSNGFAHRDLKPENILFDSKHRIKLIDFGLAGHSKDNPSMLLKTCCGSPAYAAPELIAGDIYSGPLVDVWSAGVILYTLLIGKLPFEDDNLGHLYKKIQSGIYHLPLWLTKDARSVISSMLQVNPRNRITVQQLLKHPWMNAYQPSELIEIRKGQIDEELLWQVHKHFQTTQYGELRQNILEKFGYQTATYWLLKEKLNSQTSPLSYRVERLQCQLTSAYQKTEQQKHKTGTPTVQRPVVASPQVRARVVGIKRKIDSPTTCTPTSTPTKKGSPIKKKEPQTPQTQHLVNSQTPPISNKEKENLTQVLSPSKIPVSVKSPVFSPVNTNKSQLVNESIPLKKRKVFTPESKIPLKNESVKVTTTPSEFVTPTKQNILPLQTPKKSLLKRILATATPSQVHTPRNLTTSDSTKNLTMTMFSDPQECIQKLIEGLKPKGIDCKQKGFTIRCAMNNKFANVLTFNLEICQFHDKVAIQRKRLRGDAWNYKKICEEILRISNAAPLPEFVSTSL